MFLENEIMYNHSFTVEDKIMDKDFLLPIGKAKIMREGNKNKKNKKKQTNS